MASHPRLRLFVRVVLPTALATLLLVVVVTNVTGPEKQLERRVAHLHDPADAQFRREMSVMLGPTIVPGNRVTVLNNGDEIFPAMLAAIDSATTTITFETYVYWSGDVGARFAEALSARARAGVAVHVLLDWAGSMKMDGALLDAMEAAGVEVQRYHPLRWYTLDRLNNRTHRKLLVVDGRIGFTGGVGIADEWTGHAQDPDHWRDVHFRVEGPVVAQLQAAFLDNWLKTSGEVLHGPPYFPPLDSAGTFDAQMFLSSPGSGSGTMRLMYLMALGAATRTVDLEAAYFVPDGLILEALIAASARGVRVRVLVPGEHMDAESVRFASRHVWGELLRAGVEIHEYVPTMLHNKVLIVDGFLVSVGSTNFDVRSFDLNDEASLNVYDAGFARAMGALFEHDLAQSRPYTLAMWEDRPFRERFMEKVVLPFRSQL